MSIAASRPFHDQDYPTSDGRPMAETDTHRVLMITSIETLDHFFADQPMVYVSGNLLVFYEEGNRRRHVAPDTLVVKGVPKGMRDHYLMWVEGKTLDAVMEYTSKTTRHEDLHEKFDLYERLKVKEYFLFDPLGDYLKPRLKGYRLRQDKYVEIRPVKGRLPSKVLGLHLEADGADLRFYNPATKQWLPTPEERLAQAELAKFRAEAENRRLRQELEQLRRQTRRR